jgi:hypothetical protein
MRQPRRRESQPGRAARPARGRTCRRVPYDCVVQVGRTSYAGVVMRVRVRAVHVGARAEGRHGGPLHSMRMCVLPPGRTC